MSRYVIHAGHASISSLSVWPEWLMGDRLAVQSASLCESLASPKIWPSRVWGRAECVAMDEDHAGQCSISFHALCIFEQDNINQGLIIPLSDSTSREVHFIYLSIIGRASQSILGQDSLCNVLQGQVSGCCDEKGHPHQGASRCDVSQVLLTPEHLAGLLVGVSIGWTQYLWDRPVSQCNMTVHP